MRSFASFSWFLILVPMALFVGCGDSCGKKEKTVETPAAQAGGSTAASEAPSDSEKKDEEKPAAVPTDAGSSPESVEDTAAYVKTQYEGTLDAESTRQDPGVQKDSSFDTIPSDQTQGKTYDTTTAAAPGGAGADTWTAGSKEGPLPDRQRLTSCAHKNTSLKAKDLCEKINVCSIRETCVERLDLDGALINKATAEAFKSCVEATSCDAVGDRNDGLYGHCFEKAIKAQPAQGASTCAKVGAKLEECSLSGSATAFKKRCGEVFKPLRSTVVDAYALCANASCGDIVKCIKNAGCGTFSLE